MKLRIEDLSMNPILVTLALGTGGFLFGLGFGIGNLWMVFLGLAEIGMALERLWKYAKTREKTYD